MEMQEYIPINLFCKQHGVAITVVSSMQECGLIELIRINEEEYLEIQKLAETESFVRMYSDLNINPEGIDAIVHLLQRIKAMQSEIMFLKNRLNRYEELDL